MSAEERPMRASSLLVQILAFALLLPLLAGAETFVTKDGTTYVGDVVIRGQTTIVVRTDDGNVTLKKEDLLQLPAAALEARGHLWKGKQARKKADKAYLLEDLGMASHYYKASLAELASIPASTEKEFALARDLIQEVKARLKELEATLDERGLAAYQGQLFKKDALEHHLGEGHILVGKGIWISPSQVCERCEGKGWMPCEACSSTGYVTVPCPRCKEGRLVCPICRGTGSALCPSCKGLGKYVVNCPKCNGMGTIECRGCGGTGTVWKYYPYYPYRRHRGTCPRCGGRGRVTCTWCGGKRTVEAACPTCQGAGHVPCPKTVQCRHCKGTGKIKKVCEACAGRRYVLCPVCHGKRYTGEPCPDPDSSAPKEPKKGDGQ